MGADGDRREADEDGPHKKSTVCINIFTLFRGAEGRDEERLRNGEERRGADRERVGRKKMLTTI